MVDKSLQRASKKLMAYLDANAGNNPAYHDAAIYIRILQADVEAQRKAKGEARRAAADAEAAAMGLMAERDRLKAELERVRADANRFVWLRTHAVGHPLVGLYGDELAAEIDAEMGKGGRADA